MGISIWQLLIVLLIVLVLFGTKRLRNIGSDLGGAIKSFKSAVKDGETESEDTKNNPERLEEKHNTYTVSANKHEKEVK